MAALKDIKKKIRKVKRQSGLTEGDKRLIAVISAIIALVCIGVGFFIAMQPKTVVTDTGKFIVTEEGNTSDEIILTIEGKIPDGYKMSKDVSSNEYFTFDEITTPEDQAANKQVFKLTPKERGAANLDFYYISSDGYKLYTKLHYTVEVYNDYSMKLLTLNVTD